MLPWLCRFPSIPLSFNLAAVLPRRSASRVSSDPQPCGQRSSGHRLRLGLQGYLIPFAPLAFVPQCQSCPRYLPSPSVFLIISTHFTATLSVPVPPNRLDPISFLSGSEVEPRAFKQNLTKNLRTLYAQ